MAYLNYSRVDLDKDISAMADPKTSEQWTLAMNNPYSPLYKLMMNVLSEKAAEEMLVEELVERWIQHQIQHDKREREEIIRAALKEAVQTEIKQREEIKAATSAEKTVPANMTVEQLERMKTALKDEIDNLHLETDLTQKKIYEINQNVAMTDAQLNTAAQQWRQRHQVQAADLAAKVLAVPLSDAAGLPIPVTPDMQERVAAAMIPPAPPLVMKMAPTLCEADPQILARGNAMRAELLVCIERFKPDQESPMPPSMILKAIKMAKAAKMPVFKHTDQDVKEIEKAQLLTQEKGEYIAELKQEHIQLNAIQANLRQAKQALAVVDENLNRINSTPRPNPPGFKTKPY